LSLRVPLTLGLPQLSVAVAVPGLMFAEQVPESVLLVIFAGQLMAGASLSLTVIVWSHEELLPALSVAVQ
jgi:hypothetical protein